MIYVNYLPLHALHTREKTTNTRLPCSLGLNSTLFFVSVFHTAVERDYFAGFAGVMRSNLV